MNKYTLPIVAGFVMGIIGFIVGHQIGANKNNEQSSITETIESNDGPLGGIKNNSSKIVKDLSYSDLKAELLKKEKENYLKYLDVGGDITIKKEGAMFNKVPVSYFRGDIYNNALLLSVKDIKIQIDYYSFTDTKIKSETIIIYDYLWPQIPSDLYEKVNAPDNVKTIKCKIISATITDKTREEYYSEE